MLRPHAFGGIAEACIAYEILRDPIRRRAYDASIGLKPQPQPRASSSGPPIEPTAFRALSPYPVQRSTIDATLPAAPKANPVSPPEPHVEPAPSPPSTALPRQPDDPTPRQASPAPKVKPEPRIRQEAEAKFIFAPQTGRDLPPHLVLEEQLGVEASPVDWKRTGMIAGAIAAITCLLGAIAGWWSAGDIANPQQPENTVSVPLPQAKPLATAQVPQPAPASYVAEALPVRQRRAASAVAGIERTSASPQNIAAEIAPQGPEPQENQAGQGEPGPIAGAQGDALAPLAPTEAASMPLPSRVIARTIERIGYSCGAVASTSPVEGDAPGVFKVSCTSGQSYQARPVNGRYRFRRWGRN